MHHKGFWAGALVSAVVAALLVVGPTGPATASTVAVTATSGAGRVGPGVQLVTAGRACSASFVFRAGHRVFLGYAASCATRTRVTGTDSCHARPLPRGTRVRIVDRGHTVGHGRLAYSSLRALRRTGVTDVATCAANDFALVRLRGAARHRVATSMPYWGGPTGLAPLPAAGSTVFGLARPSRAARTLPRAGQVVAVTGSTATVNTPLPSTRASRGGGFLDDAGRAVGILTASVGSGDNVVVSLADAITFARAHGLPRLRLVRGRDGFSGAAIL
jgi:hypothetical protein